MRKIKKLKDSQIEKQMAMSDMIRLKKSKIEQPQSNLVSFVNNKNQPQNLDKDVIFTIKNLDENKIKFIDKEEKVNEIL